MFYLERELNGTTIWLLYIIQECNKYTNCAIHLKRVNYSNLQSTSPPLSIPNQVAEINTSPPTTDDRLIFNFIDFSAQFHSFNQDVNNRIKQGVAITAEEHAQHLLALSSILLLKPARAHKNLQKHIDLNT